MSLLKTTVCVAGLIAGGVVLGADSTKANLQLTMLTKINPQALALWDITNNAQDAHGDFDGSKMTSESWEKVAQLGKALEDGGRTLASSNGIIAAPAGAKLQGESPGSSTAADVQRRVDAMPAVFRRSALKLQKTGAAFALAGMMRDAKRLSELADSLDGVCDSCHEVFWDPKHKN